MPTTVFEGVVQATNIIAHDIIQGSYFSVLANDDNIVRNAHGKEYLYRRFDFKPDGSYPGYFMDMPNGGSVRWKSMKCDMDRYSRYRVDGIEEMASYLDGMPSSIGILQSASFRNGFASTMDAYACPKLVSYIPKTNRYMEANGTVDSRPQLNPENSITDTILAIQGELSSIGMNADVFCFMNSHTYAQLNRELANRGGIYANMSAVNIERQKLTSELPFAADQNISLTFNVSRINNIVIIPVPAYLMNDEVNILPGHDGAGNATAGGFEAKKVVGTNSTIRMLFVPQMCAAFIVKYMISQIAFPAALVNKYSNVTADIMKLNGVFSGMLEIANAGINQLSNDIVVDNRFIYGLNVLEGMQKYMFSVEKLYDSSSTNMNKDELNSGLNVSINTQTVENQTVNKQTVNTQPSNG